MPRRIHYSLLDVEPPRMELRDIWRRGRGPPSLAARRPLDAGKRREQFQSLVRRELRAHRPRGRDLVVGEVARLAGVVRAEALALAQRRRGWIARAARDEAPRPFQSQALAPASHLSCGM